MSNGAEHMFYYTAFGLALASTLELPELAPGTNVPADIEIRQGPAPASLEPPFYQGVCFQVRPSEFLLHVPGIARYWIQDGRQITIDAAPDAAADPVRLFLYNSVFGVVLQQRGLLVLHGSAVATDQGAILFLGASASGKSTLAAEFARRGYRVLTDEICAIDFPPEGPRLWPGTPNLMIWADAAEKLGLPLERLKRVRQELEKYYVPVEGFSVEGVRVRGGYVLGVGNSPSCSRAQVKGLPIFMELANLTFHLRYVKEMQLQRTHFTQIRNLVEQIPIFRVNRPLFSFFLTELADLVERDPS